jgi:hypothetical protein
VGYATLPGSSDYHATVWNGKTITDLGTLGGATTSEAQGINAAGEIVGISGTDVATLWKEGKPTALESLISPTLAQYINLTDATAINDNGQILALGTDSLTHSQYAYLLTPIAPAVPLPASGWLLLSSLSGLGILFRQRKRRRAASATHHG